MKISVCVPMYNESSIIADTAAKLHRYMTEHFENDFEIVFADDGSRDGSADIVNSLGLSGVRVVGYEKNQGCIFRACSPTLHSPFESHYERSR